MIKYKIMYTCSCCAETFTVKRKHATHEKKCTNMQGIEVEHSHSLSHSLSQSRSQSHSSLPAAMRFRLWNATFGERQGAGACYCCGREVTQQTFEAGHILARAQGGSDQLSNLRVICRSCNASMGTTHMDTFIARYR